PLPITRLATPPCAAPTPYGAPCAHRERPRPLLARAHFMSPTPPSRPHPSDDPGGFSRPWSLADAAWAGRVYPEGQTPPDTDNIEPILSTHNDAQRDESPIDEEVAYRPSAPSSPVPDASCLLPSS